jgi:hypothetical protein
MASIKTIQLGDTLEIKKLSQIYGRHKDNLFLTNHSDHPYCPYPKVTNTSHIVRPGTKVAVIAKGKAETKYRESFVTVVHNNVTFDIMATDLRRFCK